jgi:hypothetical protein
MKIIKNWKRYLSIIGLLIFIYLIIKLDIIKIINTIKSLDLRIFLLAFLFVFIFQLTQTFKWFVLANKQGIHLPFLEALKINLKSNFYGLITPSKLGVVMRGEYLKKYAGSIGKGVSNFVLDKLLDIFSVFFLAILFSFIFRNKFNFIPLNFFILLFLLFILLSLLLISKKKNRFLLRFFYNKIVPDKLKKKAKSTYHSFYSGIPGKGGFLIVSIFNILNWIILYLTNYLVGLSLGVDIPFIYFLAILPIGTLISLIPISINGLGTREAALISLFGLFGVGAEKIFSMSILSLIITGILPSLIAIIFLFKK